jgi:hypothetical protein
MTPRLKPSITVNSESMVEMIRLLRDYNLCYNKFKRNSRINNLIAEILFHNVLVVRKLNLEAKTEIS